MESKTGEAGLINQTEIDSFIEFELYQDTPYVAG